MSFGDFSISLKKIPRPSEVLSKVDDGKLEEKSFSKGDYQDTTEREAADVEALVQRNKNTKANRKLRKNYANKVYKYLVYYSIFVALVLLASGFNIFGFYLEETVLDFLVGSTAASAIGLVHAVTWGLFRNLD